MDFALTDEQQLIRDTEHFDPTLDEGTSPIQTRMIGRTLTAVTALVPA